MFIKTLKLFLVLFFITFISSCTREVDSTATISIDTGSIGSLAYSDTVVIIVNITGGAGNPIYYFWEKCHDSNPSDCDPGTLTPPTSLSFQMPAGQNKLFQVLAAIEDPTTEEVQFQYGDKLQNVPTGDVTVNISLTAVGSGGEQFKFAGRYAQDSTPTFPSGKINTYYPPPGGKPKMYIESSYMFDGYFKLFGIDNAGFEYTLVRPSGVTTTLFSNMNLNSFPDDTYVVRVQFPSRGEYQGSSWYPGQSEHMILGYFGDATYRGGKNVCYNTAAIDDINNLCKNQDGTSCPGSNNLDWEPDDTMPSTEAVTIGDEIIRASGGVAGLCGPGTSFHTGTDKDFDITLYTSGGFDTIRGFNGPFYVSMTGTSIQAYGSTTNDIVWNYVANPGSLKAFDGVDIYILDETNFDYDMFYLDCADLNSDPDLQETYLGITTVDADLAGTATGLTLNTTTESSYDLLNTDVVVICPYKGSNYLIGTAVYTNAN